MSTDLNFQQILSSLLDTDAKKQNFSSENMSFASQKPAFGQTKNWWHSVPENTKRHVFSSAEHIFKFKMNQPRASNSHWKPEDLPDQTSNEVKMAFAFFHQNGCIWLTNKSTFMALKKAFRKLALTLHPDHRQDKSTAPFLELQRHFKILNEFIGGRSFGT